MLRYIQAPTGPRDMPYQGSTMWHPLSPTAVVGGPPRWPLVLFFSCIDVSAFNAFVLFTAVDPSWNQQKYRRRLFLQELGKWEIHGVLRDRADKAAPAYSSCCCHGGGVTDHCCRPCRNHRHCHCCHQLNQKESIFTNVLDFNHQLHQVA
ncbi:hypothetical protein UPYG_G00065690 [Umbra pygmaea]|uniref:Uncharacterized protein n=1 Tax=Umbra pygmaea TaxID=75934 RepID=A0ABD0XAC7_UMBPY